MSPQSYFLGKVGLVLVTSVLQFALTLVVAGLLLGVDLPTDASKWLNFVWIFALGAAAGSVLGIAFSVIPQSGRSASAVITPVVLVLQFISGVFFVYNDLPPWMRTIAVGLPAEVAGPGDALGVPAGLFEAQEVGGSWQLGTGAIVLTVWLWSGCSWPALLPLDPPRRGLTGHHGRHENAGHRGAGGADLGPQPSPAGTSRSGGCSR